MEGSVGEHTFVFQPTPLRREPRQDAEQVSEALPGEPLAIEEIREDWAGVRTAYDYPGWLPVAALGGEPDDGWLAPREASPLAAARKLLGAPYLWGGMTGRGIDCSGLVHMSFRAVGRLVPRDAAEQAAAGTPVGNPVRGDLVAYGSPPDHVAFWLGDGRILHSAHGEGVDGVVEEREPDTLRLRRSVVFRL